MSAQQTFTIHPDGYKGINKQVFIRLVPLQLLLLLTAFCSTYFAYKIYSNLSVFIAILGSIGAIYLLLTISIRKQKEQLKSYRLYIDDTILSKEEKNTPLLIMCHEEVAQIIRQTNGTITIKSSYNPLVPILVPLQLHNYDILVDALNKIRPVVEITSTTFQK